jgi:hypothetical protein
VHVLIYRMKHTGDQVHVSDAGIHAVFQFLHFTPPVIIPGRCNHSGGDKGSCINSHICPTDFRYMAAQGVDAAAGLVLPI